MSEPASDPSQSRFLRWRRRVASRSISGSFEGLARLGARAPQARPERHGVRVRRDLPYRDGGAPHWTLDLYEPLDVEGPAPTVLYVHGGGFHSLSKNTHWLMGLQFARKGYRVVNINYRLAPEHPFPAAPQDVCAALEWVVDHAAEHGFDTERLIFAGESAGANLVTMLAICCLWERPEPWARGVFERRVVPRAVLPACGILQVHEPERYIRPKGQPTFIQHAIYNTCDSYLAPSARGPGTELASPLTVLEAMADPPERPLPAWFAPVGDKDPVKVDSARLEAAVARLGGVAEAPVYPGELHAFHAFLWREQARDCWRSMLRFSRAHLEPS